MTLSILKPTVQMLLTDTHALKGVCGIYRLTNHVTGKVYIGSSVDIRGRTEALKGNQHTAGHTLSPEHKATISKNLQQNWDTGTRSREAAAERMRARWANPQYRAQYAATMAGKAAERQAT